MIFLAHGIGGVRDLPVPESFFFTTAAIVLVVSFVLLGLLWKRPLLEAHAEGRLLPRVRQRRLPLDSLCGSCSSSSRSSLFVVTLATALFGIDDRAPELRADLRLRHLLARSSAALDPVRERVARAQPVARLADATVWVLERGGREARPVLEWSDAGVGIRRLPRSSRSSPSSSTNPRPAYPRTLAIATALYSYWALAGMAVYGREAWTRGGEGFAVMFQLLSRIAPFAVRDGAASSCAGPSPASAGSDRGCWSAGLRRRDDRLHELRRLLAHDQVEQPHRRHPRGSRRIVSAHGRSRDDARRTSRD